MKNDFLEVETPASKYKQLKNLDLLRGELSTEDPSISTEDWLAFNQGLEAVAQPEQDLTQQQVDVLASGKAGLVHLTDVVSNYLTVEGQPFGFDGREYLRGVYNYFDQYPEGCKNTLLLASRQVEKCQLYTLTPSNDYTISSPTTVGNQMQGKSTHTTRHTFTGRILTATGEYKHVQDIQLGDRLVTYDMDTHTSSSGAVTWRSDLVSKPVYKITTRQGHQVTVGHEHPLYDGENWVNAEDWKPKDKIAVVGAATYLSENDVATAKDIAAGQLLGHLVAEGSLTETGNWVFHTGDVGCLEDFRQAADTVGVPLSDPIKYKNDSAYTQRIRVKGREVLTGYGLKPATSFTKEVPQWLWKQGREVRAAFLSRAWSGDGHVKQVHGSKIDIVYCSVSEKLIKDVQALLWGFGIPSGIRVNKPTLYKGTEKVAFILRVETQRGIHRFLDEIGALHKTAAFEPTFKDSNSNIDTLPKAPITAAIHRVFPKGNNKGGYLFKYGLSRSPAYALTRGKLQRYIDAAIAEGLDPQPLMKWTSDSIYWDTVVAVECLGQQTCRDFTVEAEHNYVINGIITHNSTSQAAKSCALGMVFPSYQTLYVAPRYNQVVIFSQQRFKPMCEDSPRMMDEFVNPGKNLWQVLAKQFSNGSFFNFRSCYRDADSARGISANHLLIDEIQDIPPDAIPVLEQCQAHSSDELKYRMYAGTPKSTGNILSLRWEDTCQFEWMTKCRHCGHWNMCDESIVHDEFYGCAKCRKEVYPHADGQWVPRNTALLNKRWGFHLSQIMVPFKKHKHIIEGRDDPNISRGKYLNEILGLAYDEGDSGINDKDLEKACKPERMLQPLEITEQYAKRGYKIYAGIDYGTGEGTNPSLTVLTIGTMQRNGIFRVLFMKKFRGKEAESVESFNIINRICDQASVDWLGADWGHGAHQNARLERERGWRRTGNTHVLMEFKYVTQHKELSWTGKYYHVDRNQTMDRCIDGIRNCDTEGGIIFFNYEDFQDFRYDFTTISIEYNEKTGGRKYVHQLPDDSFHSLNYAYMAARQGSGLGVPVSYYS